MSHVQILALIIIGAGILCGITNFLLEYKLEYKKKECWINLAKYVFLSLCASIAVPLFLQTLSSNLIDETTLSINGENSGKFPNKNYFIFAGFCVVAAFYSRRFLDDLYNKLKDIEKKTDDNEKKIEDNAKKTSDVDRKVDDLEETMDDTVPTDVKNFLITNDRMKLDEAESQKLITSLFSSKYSFRTIKGISAETELPIEKIQAILDHLAEMGFAERKVNYRGSDIWRLLKYPIKIYSASYGVPGHLIDVTIQIQQMISNGIYEGQVLPSTFRIQDPAPYVSKSLKIHCRIRGKEAELIYNDGETFRIS